SHAITAVYGGDASFTGSTSGAVIQTVNQATSSVVVTLSANPAVSGQPITLSVVVSASTPGAGTPTGTVIFLDGTTSLGSASLVNGVATFTTSNLSVGSHLLTAVFPGDANFAGKTSAPLIVSIGQANTTTVLSSGPNPSVFGQAVAFTITVSATA